MQSVTQLLRNFSTLCGSPGGFPWTPTIPLTSLRSGAPMAKTKIDPATKLVPGPLVRFTQAELEELREAASHHGMSLSAFIRSLALSAKLPRQPLPKVDKDTYAELGKVGSNLNQLAKQLNQADGVYPNQNDLVEGVKWCVSWIKKIRMELWK